LRIVVFKGAAVKGNWIAVISVLVLANGSLGHAEGRTLEDRRRQLEAGLQKRLDSVDKELKELGRSADKQGRQARGELEGQVHSLQERERELDVKLDRLKASSKSAWKDLRIGLERAIKDLESAVKAPEKKKSKYYRL
jgi:hypothetical protein